MDAPDQLSTTFLRDAVDPLRYDHNTGDRDEVSDILPTLIPVGSRVLDVGCGTGSLSALIAKTRQAQVIGVEPDEERAAAARSRGISVTKGLLSQSLIEGWPPFDVVIMADVLEHLTDPRELLLLCKQALKPDGRIVFSVPNVAHWSIRLDLLWGKFRYDKWGIMDVTHLRWFDWRNVELLCESAGLNIQKREVTLGHFLPAYHRRRPFCWIPATFRQRLARAGGRWFPKLFACQFVVSCANQQ